METLRRALRTFVQAAAGYVAAHAALLLAGGNAGESLRGALTMIITASVASGLAAVMNLPEKKTPPEEDEKDE